MMSLTRYIGDLTRMTNMKRKPTLRDFKNATLLCAKYEALIYFGYTGDGSEVDVEFRDINIDLEEVNNMHIFWSLVFHELGHIWCYDNGKYVKYHQMNNMPEKEIALYIRRNGLRIEKYVDRIGKKLGKESGIKFRFRPAYKTKKDIKWYHAWIERTFPL